MNTPATPPDPDGPPDAVLRALSAAAAVWIAAHDRPDGDAAGSALGLSRLLSARGVPTRILGLEPLPPPLAFLPDGNDPLAPPDAAPPDGALLVMLDCSEADRLAAAARPWADRLPVVVIDHHATGEARAERTNWIDPALSSTGEMVTRLALAAGWTIPAAAATALWVAVATDTGRFCFSNAGPSALRTAAELVARGARPADLSEKIWGSPRRAELLLAARAYASLKLHFDGRLATVRLSRADFEAVGAGPESSQEIVNGVRGVDGSRATFFLYEPAAGRVKLSVRTAAPHDATLICRPFGGGGHVRAAGCDFAGLSLDQAEARALEAAGRLFFNA